MLLKISLIVLGKCFRRRSVLWNQKEETRIVLEKSTI
jgi:hypothetical protein